MSMPLRFPDHRDVIRQDAEAFRRLSPDDRVLRLLGFLACGRTLIAESPHCGVIREQQRRYEEAWQSAHRKLLEAHGI